MTHFMFRAEFEDNRSVELVPEYIHPLGFPELLLLANNASAPLKLTIEGTNVIVDGSPKDGRATVNATINFNEQTSIYALVPGGWLPLPCVIPPRFLVDRNVVIALRKIRSGQTTSMGKAVEWWTKLLDSNGSATFNPLPYAFESGLRRKPTMAEFVAAFDEGVAELTQAVPNSSVIRLDEISYRAAYAQLEAFDNRNEKEIQFLCEVSPLIAQRISRNRENRILKEILAIAKTHAIALGTLVTLAVLSCLYEDPTGNVLAIGRRVLKPTLIYTESDAFNALSDLRHIEVAAAGQIYFQNDIFSLCTGDRGLAMLWSALAMRGEALSGDSIEFTFDLTSELFHRLDESGIQNLRQRLKA